MSLQPHYDTLFQITCFSFNILYLSNNSELQLAISITVSHTPHYSLWRLAPASGSVPRPPGPSGPHGESAALPSSDGTAGCGTSYSPEKGKQCEWMTLCVICLSCLCYFLIHYSKKIHLAAAIKIPKQRWCRHQWHPALYSTSYSKMTFRWLIAHFLSHLF